MLASSFFLNMVGIARATYVGDLGRELEDKDLS